MGLTGLEPCALVNYVAGEFPSKSNCSCGRPRTSLTCPLHGRMQSGMDVDSTYNHCDRLSTSLNDQSWMYVAIWQQPPVISQDPTRQQHMSSNCNLVPQICNIARWEPTGQEALGENYVLLKVPTGDPISYTANTPFLYSGFKNMLALLHLGWTTSQWLEIRETNTFL